MSHPPAPPFRPSPSPRREFAVLLSCYMTGATRGQNVGIAGYSYDFVAQLFVPLLERWGTVIPVAEPQRNLEAAIAAARARRLEPVHVSFLPMQDVHLARSAPNVVVPAWEFPDVPNEPFDGNPQNDWPATANRCARVIVGGPFTEEAFRKGGTTVPISIVPVPTPEPYFAIDPWAAGRRVRLECPHYAFPQPLSRAWDPRTECRPSMRREVAEAVRAGIYRAAVRTLGPVRYQQLRAALRRRRGGAGGPAPIGLPLRRDTELELSGVVYTSIFNPLDGRKNWEDLITGFLAALGDREDATLVLKVVNNHPLQMERVLRYYLSLDLPHRCRVVFTNAFLSEEQMRQLTAASTYYLQTTKAEGNCLPLMNYLAAGRPAVTPCHSAIGDYFDPRVGWVVESHPEPSAWPIDGRLRFRTTWARLVWPSLVEQLRASYEAARRDPAAYGRMADAARQRMLHWAAPDVVAGRLHAALDATMNVSSAAAEPRRRQAA